ncbi:MAG: carboxymuconolactone decarboxylase family protein [Desulfuromusa sp.]|nr:carboxymuconolactone decarboxylase family protein [Desulfuromusa sp.]
MRIEPKDYAHYPWYLKPFFWKQFRTYGQLLKPALLWAREPKLFTAVACLYGVLDRKNSPISPVLRSLITVRVSQINWCRFCVDINSSVLAKRAGSMDKVTALEDWRQSDLFSQQECAVLEYAEAMTDSHQHVTDEMVVQLREWFNEDAIVELTGLIAFQNLSSKFNSALDLPAQGFCQFLKTEK